MATDNTKWMKKYIADFCMLESRTKAKKVEDFIIANYGTNCLTVLADNELQVIVDFVATLEE